MLARMTQQYVQPLSLLGSQFLRLFSSFSSVLSLGLSLFLMIRLFCVNFVIQVWYLECVIEIVEKLVKEIGVLVCVCSSMWGLRGRVFTPMT